MDLDPNPNLNPYSPPRADTDAVWPSQNDGYEGRAADRGSRLGAAIIDGLLYVPVMIPGIIIVATAHGAISSVVSAAAVIFIGVLPLAIFQWYRIATTGQSLAKKWLRLRIVKLDGSPVDFVSGVLLRSWVPWLIAQGLAYVLAAGSRGNLGSVFSLVDALWIFGGPSRCLHDYIAGTKVIVA